MGKTRHKHALKNTHSPHVQITRNETETALKILGTILAIQKLSHNPYLHRTINNRGQFRTNTIDRTTMMLHAIIPNENDVLMGQSPNLRLHPGNKRLKELVGTYFDQYFAERTSKLDKTIIAKRIIHTINEEGGRFLKQPEKKRVGIIKDAVWVLEDDQIRIRDKVASQFRGHLKELKRRKPSDEPLFPTTKPEKVKRTATVLKVEVVERRQEKNSRRTQANLPLKKRKVRFQFLDSSDESSTESVPSFRDEAEFKKFFQMKAKEFASQSKLKNTKTEVEEPRMGPSVEKYAKEEITGLQTTGQLSTERRDSNYNIELDEALRSGYKNSNMIQLNALVQSLCRLNDNTIVR